MNREILFRGKRVDNGEWIYGWITTQHKKYTEGELLTRIQSNTFGEGEHYVETETVGQYIGLTDKNGTKIFEGDIVKGLFNFGLSINAKVVYYDGSFGVVCKRCGAINFTAFPSFCGVDWEVIGNIYDNPDLMEERE